MALSKDMQVTVGGISRVAIPTQYQSFTDRTELTADLTHTITVPNAYIKVETVSGDKATATATVTWYISENGDEIKTDTYDFIPSMDGANFIQQAYEHLKTLSEFSGATDI